MGLLPAKISGLINHAMWSFRVSRLGLGLGALRLSTAGNMSLLARKTDTLFDHIPEHLTNLSLGAPTDTLLKKCSDILITATQHRMVSSY